MYDVEALTWEVEGPTMLIGINVAWLVEEPVMEILVDVDFVVMGF